VFAERFEITLKKGWNSVSIPCESFYVVSVDKNIYQGAFIYNINTANYEFLDIKSLTSQRGGIWLYSYKDGTKLVVECLAQTQPSQISRKLLYYVSNKPTLLFLEVPMGGIDTSKLREYCDNASVYYYNNSDNCWYVYWLDNKTYKKYCGNSWINLGEIENIYYPQGVGIWVKFYEGCQKKIENRILARREAEFCGKREGNEIKPDPTKCGDGYVCIQVVNENNEIDYVCKPCSSLDEDKCKLFSDRCGLILRKTRDGEKYECASKPTAEKFFYCDNTLCAKDKGCCIPPWWAIWKSAKCFNPQSFSCKDGDLVCSNDFCNSNCQRENMGRGSCTLDARSDTVVKKVFTDEDGNFIECYCQYYKPEDCNILKPGNELTEAFYGAMHPLYLEFTLNKKCTVDGLLVRVVDDSGRVVAEVKPQSESAYSDYDSDYDSYYIFLTVKIEKLPTTYKAYLSYRGKELGLAGTIDVKPKEQTLLNVKVLPQKDVYANGETVSLIVEGYTTKAILSVEVYKILVKDNGEKIWGSQVNYLHISPGPVNKEFHQSDVSTPDIAIKGVKFQASFRFYDGSRHTSSTPLLRVSLTGETTSTTSTTSSTSTTSTTTTTTPSCKKELEDCSSDSDCCSGLKCIKDSFGFGYCTDPSKFSCSGDTLYYSGLYFVSCSYCCSNKNACGGLSACCKKSEAECGGTSTTSTTSSTSTTSTTSSTSTTSTTLPASGNCKSGYVCVDREDNAICTNEFYEADSPCNDKGWRICCRPKT
jgi:hypothetical protein